MQTEYCFITDTECTVRMLAKLESVFHTMCIEYNRLDDCSTKTHLKLMHTKNIEKKFKSIRFGMVDALPKLLTDGDKL